MVTERAHVNSIRSKTEKKAIRLPVVLSGGSLEPAGNGWPRQMITQRHNPAYRSARTKKETLISKRFFFCSETGLFIAFTAIFLLTILTSVNFLLRVSEDEYVIQALLDGSDAAWVLTFDDVCDLFWKFQDPFLNDLLVFDDVDGDVVIDETEDVQVEVLDRAFYLDDVLDTHFVALGILDDGNGAVKFVEFQVMINGHGFAGLDMVKYETFVKCSNV